MVVIWQNLNLCYNNIKRMLQNEIKKQYCIINIILFIDTRIAIYRLIILNRIASVLIETLSLSSSIRNPRNETLDIETHDSDS